jgi:hypothetical protein
MLHSAGAPAAKLYLGQSKVGEWANHTNPSMAGNNSNVLAGFDWYIAQDAADGRPAKDLDATTVISLPAGPVIARLDVVLDDGDDLAARVVLWDAPSFDSDVAPVMACAYAYALQALYPFRSFTTIGIWQARRQRRVEVPYADALAQTQTASAVLATM